MNTPRTPSPMPHQFGSSPAVNIRRSTFRRDKRHLTTFDAGLLIPFYVDDILPGDTVNLNATILARLSTPLAPIMDGIYLDSHFFFVPNRLLWDNWERFCGAQDNPGDSTDFLIPRVQAIGSALSNALSIYDYMGIPTGINDLRVNALPFRAYSLIYNEFFRDQDLIGDWAFPTDNGPDGRAEYTLFRRAKRPDYFTTCRPWTQKGPEVMLPLGDTAPVIGDGTAMGFMDGAGNFMAPGMSTGGTGDWRTARYGQTLPHITTSGLVTSGRTLGLTTDPDNSGVIADLSNASSATINAFRFALLMQQKYEIDARSGTRYVEYIRAHFGVISPDFRLQRPEYLGGGSQRMDMMTVANTNLETASADLGAYGISVGSRHGFMKSFVEHGWIIGIVSARADLTYQQGIPRMFLRQTLYDHYHPIFAHLGEQAVTNAEIFAQGTTADDDVFGYQERYSEYKYGISQISGLFRSSHPQSLDVWHLSQEFASLPLLNQTFVEENPPIDRCVAVPSEPHIICDTYFSVKHTRPMPVKSIPGLMGHF